jgi:hypothetical protein
MYCLLYRIETGKEPNVASYLVTNAVFILGFFTLALLLGEQQQHSSSIHATQCWANQVAIALLQQHYHGVTAEAGASSSSHARQ